MKYNLLTEPWIPVAKPDGTVYNIGLMELFENAHTYARINDASPICEYGILRFLSTMVMDAFHPKAAEDIEDMVDEGRFDMGIINRYLAACRDEGVTFDLFDKTHPFLQAPYDEAMDAKKRNTVAKLDPSKPSGRNHVIFDYTKEDDSAITPAEAARNLCGIYIFCTVGAQGYPSTVNGAPPLFTVVKGQNLYETIVYACVYDGMPGVDYNGEPPLWRRTETILPKRDVAKTSFLSGMIFPTRRICLDLPGEDGMIHSIWFQQGENYSNYDAWTDPHVIYRFTNNGRSSIKPDVAREPWRDIASLADYSKSAPLVVKQYMNISDTSQVELILYGVATGNASYFGWQRQELVFPAKVAKNPILIEQLKKAVNVAEYTEKILREAVCQLSKTPANGNELARRISTEFFAACGYEIMGTFCDKLTACETAKEGALEELDEEWSNWLDSLAKKKFYGVADGMGSSSANMFLEVMAEAQLLKKLKQRKKV